MADEGSDNTLNANRRRITAAFASLSAGTAFYAFWCWLFSHWFGSRVDASGGTLWRSLAAIPSVLGFSVALRCVWDFASTGHGSPAPFAPPQSLVVVGPYRYVRNPIYVGGAAGWIGLWIAFGRASLASIATITAALIGVHMFVVLYEERTLRKKFGLRLNF